MATGPHKYDHFFDTAHLQAQLRGRAISGGFGMMTAQAVSFMLRTGSMVVLARILVPADFGLVAMVNTVMVVAENFKDLGLSTATVQRNDITHNEVSTLFWVNVCFGMLSMLVVASLSWVIAWFFHEPRLLAITFAISSCLFLGGLAVQHQALLQRQMRFAKIAWITVASDGLSVAVGITLAFGGFGYWSLIWREVARSFFIAAGTWLVCGWRPGRPSRSGRIGSLLRFGTHISGFNLVTFFSQNFDQILLGKFWGAGPLGLYKQARLMLGIPLSQIQNPVIAVAQPTLSALQADPRRYSAYCEKIVSTLSFGLMPLLVYLALFSDIIVRTVLGEKWIESAPIFRIFALAGLLSAPASTCGLVMITCGKTVQYLRFGIVSALLVIVAFSIGALWGAVGVAAAYTITAYVWILPSLWYSFRGTPVSIAGIFKAVFAPAFCSFSMGLFLLILSPDLSRFGALEIPASLCCGCVSYFGVWLLLPGGRAKLKEYISYPLMALGLTVRPEAKPSV